MNPIAFISFIAMLVVTGLGLVFVANHGLEHPPSDWRYVDLLTILLTTAVVVITALGIGIAILGVWGYTQIQNNAVDKAVRTVPQHVTSNLKAHLDGEEFRQLVISQLERIQREHAAQRMSDGAGGKGNAGTTEHSAEFPELP